MMRLTGVQPHFAARYKVNAPAQTVQSGVSAVGFTASVAPDFIAPVMQAVGLGSWVAPMMADPAMAGLLTSIGGSVVAESTSQLVSRADNNSKLKDPS